MNPSDYNLFIRHVKEPSMHPQANLGRADSAHASNQTVFAGTKRNCFAFTLVELLVVMAIILIMMVVALPAFNAIKGGGDVTKAAYDVAGALEAAATYARAANTYVWVGFYEENGSVASAKPATPGVGRLVISVVYSKDGTQIVNPTSGGTAIDPTRLGQLGRLIKVDNMHFGDVPNPGSPAPKGAKTDWETRPSVVSGSSTYRIGQSTPAATAFSFQYPVGSATAQYTFTKMIQFSPQGVAVMNVNSGIWPWLEIGLQPARGNVADTTTPNVVAVQVGGINPQTRIYRR